MLTLLISFILIYFQTNGASSSKQVFEGQVIQYVSEKYPELTIVKQKIRYSLIDMHYHSTVYTKNGNTIEVSVGYDNELQDNYNK